MRFFKMIAFAQSHILMKLSFITLLAFSLMLSACVKPRNHDSNIDSTATFYVDEVKPAMDTAETVPGFTIPSARLYTFTACVKDRRTDELLPGAPFVISGGERDQDLHTDKNGCAIWSEKITFDYLADEKYLPITRTLTAKGSQIGAREMKLAINPWNLSDKGPVMYDLDHHPDLPKSQVADLPAVSRSLSLEFAGTTKRRLFIDKLPLRTSAVPTSDGSILKNFKVYLNTSIALTNIDGLSVPIPVGVATGKLQVTAALIESRTSGGQETKTVVSQSAKPVLVMVENGKVSADLPLAVRQGTQGSRFLLALKVSPVDGPKGLEAFEGLFAVGDLKSVTEDNSTTAELKASNNDATFNYDGVVGKGVQPVAKLNTYALSTIGNLKDTDSSITNAGPGSNVKTFSISQLTPKWSGPIGIETAGLRTIKYLMTVCVTDNSNGGRPADGIEFSIQLSNRKWIKQTASTVDALHGCLFWEDQVTHRYYEPEHFLIVPVTIKHKSGYSETRQYAIDPWQSFRFSADPMMTPQFIQDTNARATSLKSYMVADSIEFNTLENNVRGSNQSNTRYQVDDYLGLTIIKHAALRIPIKVVRPSNVVDGINPSGEPLRTGRYLLKATYVSPVANPFDKSSRLIISPMAGLQQVVDVKNGSVYANLWIPVSDIRLFNSRAYLVFEVYLLDENKIPKNNPSLTGLNASDFIDRESQLVTPTFAAVVNVKNEKDSSGIVRNTADLGAMMPAPDAVSSVAMRNQISPNVRQAIAPLANQTVASLDEQARRDKEAYVATMKQQRTYGLVAQRASSELVFATHEDKNSENDKALQTNNRILPPASRALGPLLKMLNTPLESLGASEAKLLTGGAPLNVTADSLLNALDPRQPINPKLAAQFCGYFFSIQPRTKVNGLAWNRVEVGPMGAWLDLCLEEVKAHGAASAFLLDRRVRVAQTAGVTALPGRSDLQVKVGSSVSFSQTAAETNATGAGWGTGGITSVIAQGLVSNGGKALKFVGAALGGLGLEVSHSSAATSATQTGFALEDGHPLSIEQTNVRINVTMSDDCLIIRPSLNMFKGLRSSLHLKIFRYEVGNSDAADELMNRGLMVCGGRINTTPRQLTEHYYTLLAINPVGTANDNSNAINLPWMTQLRSQHDFAEFMVFASGKNDSKIDVNAQLEVGDMPNELLQARFDQYFANQLNSMPGYISLAPTIIYHPQK